MEGCGVVWVRAQRRRVAAGHLAYARDDYSLRQEHKIRGEGGHKTRGEGARVSSLGREGEAGKTEASKTGKAEAGKAGTRRLGWVVCLTLETWLRGGEGGENMYKGVGGQGRHAVRGEKKLRGREYATGTPILGLPPVPTSVRAFFISAVYSGEALMILHTAPWWVLFHPCSQQ
jgi:hypothetical protein